MDGQAPAPPNSQDKEVAVEFLLSAAERDRIEQVAEEFDPERHPLTCDVLDTLSPEDRAHAMYCMRAYLRAKLEASYIQFAANQRYEELITHAVPFADEERRMAISATTPMVCDAEGHPETNLLSISEFALEDLAADTLTGQWDYRAEVFMTRS